MCYKHNHHNKKGTIDRVWYYTLLLSLLFLPQLILSQGVTFRHITVADGLSNNFVRTIHKDQFGFVWFGTLDGLDRYDGQEIRSFSDRLPGGQQRVNSLADHHGRGLWIGTDKGLYFWDFVSSEFETIPLPHMGARLTTLLSLPGDTLIMAGTSDGIFLINTATRVVAAPKVDMTGAYVTTGAVSDNQGTVWISTSAGLIELNLKNLSTQVHLNQQTESFYNNFSSLTWMDRSIVVGTVSRGMYLFDVHERKFTPYGNMGAVFILTLHYGNDGILYVGTDGAGLIKIHTEDGRMQSVAQDISNPNSLNSNAIYSFLLEENGRYWLGTYAGGVNFTPNTNRYFEVLNNPVYLAENSIRSMYFDREGNKFIGTREGMYVVEESGQAQKYTVENSEYLRSNVVISFGAHGDDMLVGTFRGGISKYRRGRAGIEPFPDAGIGNLASVYAFAYDKSGNILIGDLGGLTKIEAETGLFRQYNTTNSVLKDNRIIAVFYDSKERLWVGSIGGGTAVYRFDGADLIRVPTDFDLSDYKSVSFFEDHQGDVWIATEGSGLCVVHAGLDAMHCNNTIDGLSNNSVTAVTEAPDNMFWISTLRGFSRYDRSSDRFISYSLSDGLPSLVFNRGAVVNTYKKDGKVWFGSERGLVHFSPDSVLSKVMAEKVTLTDFFLSGQRVEPATGSYLDRPVHQMEEIMIKAGYGSFGFRFIALNYYKPGDNEYAYRLRGQDENWQVTTDNYVTFPELKPGTYTFEVHLSKGTLSDLSELTSVRIVVKPLFHQTKAFLILIVLLVFASVMIMLILRRRLKELMVRKNKREDHLRYISSSLSASRKQEIEAILIAYVETNKPYLHPDLKLNDLAKAIDCSPHDVSQVINQNLKKSFNDFINAYRIEAVKGCLANPAYERYTLLAIGQQCGFRSKASFYRAFKKLTGETPHDFLVQLQKEPPSDPD